MIRARIRLNYTLMNCDSSMVQPSAAVDQVLSVENQPVISRGGQRLETLSDSCSLIFLLNFPLKTCWLSLQLGVGRGKIKIQDLQDKFDKVVAKLQVPVQIFISTTGGSYRKPATGMWQILKKQVRAGSLGLGLDPGETSRCPCRIFRISPESWP